MRDERLELESRCQGLRLRGAAAEWERDELRRRVEALESAWEKHRRALRREVTTRVKVGLDDADFRGGRGSMGEDEDEGEEDEEDEEEGVMLEPLFLVEMIPQKLR